MSEAILKKYHVTAEDIIGRGPDSIVYGVDKERVLKVFSKADIDVLERRRRFYLQLRDVKVSIQFPHILEVNEFDGVIYMIEQRLQGIDGDVKLKTVQGGEARRQILVNLLETISEMRKIDLKQESFRMLLVEEDLASDKWSEFIVNSTKSIIADNRAYLDTISGFAEIETDYLKRLDELGADGFNLVHGDYWLPNVMFGDNDKASAVIDFNEQTMIGDYRIDVASAITFAQKLVSEEEMGLMISKSKELFGDDIEYFINVYAIYYALLFSGVQETDQDSYDWAIETLNGYWSMFGE